MSVDVLLPTRGRLGACVESVAALCATAAHPESLTVYLRADDDDPTPYEDAFTSAAVRVFRGPRYGYAGLFRYYNELATHSTGEWLLVWNDDAIMQTHAWDAMLPATQALTVIGQPQGFESTAGVFVHSTAHADFQSYTLPSGSIVVDPWGTLPIQPNVRYVRPGRMPREV